MSTDCTAHFRVPTMYSRLCAVDPIPAQPTGIINFLNFDWEPSLDFGRPLERWLYQKQALKQDQSIVASLNVKKRPGTNNTSCLRAGYEMNHSPLADQEGTWVELKVKDTS